MMSLSPSKEQAAAKIIQQQQMHQKPWVGGVATSSDQGLIQHFQTDVEDADNGTGGRGSHGGVGPPDFEFLGHWFGLALVLLSWFLIIITFPFSMCFTLKVVKEYERVVIFRLGRLLPGGTRGPGLIFIIPCVDNYRKMDLRVVSYAVPPQEILSKDSVTVSVDAVVYFRTSDPIAAVNNVDDAIYSTKLLAQTTLRNALGMKTLSEMLTEREAIAQLTETILDEGTEHWGIKVERVEVKDIRLPQQLTRAMAAEAEAAREARAKVIAAEGEMKASRALKEAADVISSSPVAIQLRHLQALSSIAAEHNSTIIFPVPIDIMGPLLPLANNSNSNRKDQYQQRNTIGSLDIKSPYES